VRAPRSATVFREELFGAAINAAAGVIVVIVGLITLSSMTGYLVSSVNSDDAKLAIATTAPMQGGWSAGLLTARPSAPQRLGIARPRVSVLASRSDFPRPEETQT
jgi:hypothetical protein